MDMRQKIHRFLALGDSYTSGEKVSPSQRWLDQLVQRLKLEGIIISKPTVIAKTGWTSGDLLQAIDKIKITDSFDLVTLLIGVNNQYQNLDPEAYRLEFILLVQRAIRFSKSGSNHVIVLSIPDWSVTPFACGQDRRFIKTQIERFNNVNKREAQVARVNYLDITTISRRAGDDPTLLSEDELHPSQKMYTLWVDLVFPTVNKILCNNQEEWN